MVCSLRTRKCREIAVSYKGAGHPETEVLLDKKFAFESLVSVHVGLRMPARNRVVRIWI